MRKPPRRRSSSTVAVVAPAPPQNLPDLIGRVAGSVTNVDDLAKLMALKREIDADAERRDFDRAMSSGPPAPPRVLGSASTPSRAWSTGRCGSRPSSPATGSSARCRSIRRSTAMA